MSAGSGRVVSCASGDAVGSETPRPPQALLLAASQIDPCANAFLAPAVGRRVPSKGCGGARQSASEVGEDANEVCGATFCTRTANTGRTTSPASLRLECVCNSRCVRCHPMPHRDGNPRDIRSGGRHRVLVQYEVVARLPRGVSLKPRCSPPPG
jgi:hypothetical protein